jgi:hypothetical protein
MEIMLIGWGMGVAVGSGGTGVAVSTDVGTKVFFAVAVSVDGTEVFAGMMVCVAQAVTKRAIFTITNKAFFITELLSY